MSKYWSPFVSQLTPYVPGEQAALPNLVKLNTNENPYGPSPAVLAAIHSLVGSDLRRYPDPTSGALVDAAARYFGLTREQVFAGNGSDEVLAHAFHGLLKHQHPVLFPDVSYSFYPVYCGVYGISYETVALNQRFEIDLADYRKPNGGIVFPNPNAPTGVAVPLGKLEQLLEHNRDSVVVVDEAYVDFGAESAVSLVDRFPQLLVVQTFSKSRSLAGLRVGLALGHPELIQALVRIKDSFNSYPLDRLAIAGATAALEDRAYFEQTRGAVIAARAELSASLAELGFEVLPSAANFVFARHASRGGEELARELRSRGILVRHFRAARIEQFLRITVGLPEENAKLLSALRELL
jgi:histidinol-phosphate aminotransferase